MGIKLLWAILLPFLAAIALFFAIRHIIHTIKKTKQQSKARAASKNQDLFADIIYLSLILAAIGVLTYMAIRKIAGL